MKVSYIELLGEKHPMCFSLSAIEELTDYFGSIGQMSSAMESEDDAVKLKAIGKTLDVLVKAGRRYCEATGEPMPKPLNCRPADVLDISDPQTITAIFEAISSGNERKVIAQSKNAETTQET